MDASDEINLVVMLNNKFSILDEGYASRISSVTVTSWEAGTNEWTSIVGVFYVAGWYWVGSSRILMLFTNADAPDAVISLDDWLQ